MTASLLNDGLTPSHRQTQEDRSLVIKQRERSQNSQLRIFHRFNEGNGTSARVPQSRSPVEAKSPPNGSVWLNVVPIVAPALQGNWQELANDLQVSGLALVNLDLADGPPHNRCIGR